MEGWTGDGGRLGSFDSGWDLSVTPEDAVSGLLVSYGHTHQKAPDPV